MVQKKCVDEFKRNKKISRYEAYAQVENDSKIFINSLKVFDMEIISWFERVYEFKIQSLAHRIIKVVGQRNSLVGNMKHEDRYCIKVSLRKYLRQQLLKEAKENGLLQ